MKKENIKKENEINELNDKLKYANNGYNEMNRQLMVLIEKVLKYSNLTKDDIDEIIWSTRIQKIEEIIKQFFYRK